MRAERGRIPLQVNRLVGETRIQEETSARFHPHIADLDNAGAGDFLEQKCNNSGKILISSDRRITI